jgi:hypothetical protein
VLFKHISDNFKSKSIAPRTGRVSSRRGRSRAFFFAAERRLRVHFL